MNCQVTGLPVTVTQLLGTKPYPPGNYCKSLANVFKVNMCLIQKSWSTCLLVPDISKGPPYGWD